MWFKLVSSKSPYIGTHPADDIDVYNKEAAKATTAKLMVLIMFHLVHHYVGVS